MHTSIIGESLLLASIAAILWIPLLLGLLALLAWAMVRRPKSGWVKTAMLLNMKHFRGLAEMSVVERDLFASLPFDAVNYGRPLDILIREFLGHTLIVCDYYEEHRSHTTEGRRVEAEHRTVCVMICDALDLPVCVMQATPRHVRWMRERIGKSHEFPVRHDKAFDNAFKVIGLDNREVRGLVAHDELRHFLLTLKHDDVEIECQGRAFSIQFHRPIAPENAWRLIDHANELRELLIESDTQRRGAGGGHAG
ncbi:MAG: hypothetical protein GC159_19460 [Phycisphaera sp.]|nr:hypothetical protein [Phycisphaera sp.]